MALKYFRPLKSSTAAIFYTSRLAISSSKAHFLHSISPNSSNNSNNRLMFLPPSLKYASHIYNRASGFSYASYASSVSNPKSLPGIDLEPLENQMAQQKQLTKLRQKLDKIGIDGSACMPGQNNGLICPKCKGKYSPQKCLSLHISKDGGTAMWNCFRATCEWRGIARAFGDVKSNHGKKPKVKKVKKPIREIKEESLGLEPLGSELLAYFAERMISGETLRRNGVMQKRTGDQTVIAFTYRRNKVLVSCKYRAIPKKFWQEANTEKIYYGLDDIREAREIIIVEGEMDKLAMEEAGFQNCVSVPNGAPPIVLKRPLPPEEEDIKYRYVWNCKEYTEKASRIILATDGDILGEALAEELALRLGKERCWRVKWPKKDDAEKHYEDANEVLMHAGADALRAVIENAVHYYG